MVLKADTSVSKVFGAINRLSEDFELSASTEFVELPELDGLLTPTTCVYDRPG